MLYLNNILHTYVIFSSLVTYKTNHKYSTLKKLNLTDVRIWVSDIEEYKGITKNHGCLILL